MRVLLANVYIVHFSVQYALMREAVFGEVVRPVQAAEHLKAVSKIGLEPAEMVAVVELVGKFVMSAARRVVESAQTEKDTGVTEAEWWGGRGSLFDRLGPYPTLGDIWQSGSYDRPEDPFEFGLKRVLDGIEVLVRSRKTAPSGG